MNSAANPLHVPAWPIDHNGPSSGTEAFHAERLLRAATGAHAIHTLLARSQELRAMGRLDACLTDRQEEGLGCALSDLLEQICGRLSEQVEAIYDRQKPGGEA